MASEEGMRKGTQGRFEERREEGTVTTASGLDL